MTGASLVPLPGSERGPVAGVQPAGPLDPDERIQVTLITRRATSLPRTPAGLLGRLAREELRLRHGGHVDDHDLIAQVMTGLDAAIEVTGSDPGARRLTLSGPAGALAAAFGTELSLVTSPGPSGALVTHRYRSGSLHIPAALDGILIAVLGLDDRPQASPHLRFATLAAAQQVSYTPPQIAELYQFPPGTDGTGQVVAIIELGGGFSSTDLDAYFSGLGIATPSITAVGVDGATNVPGQDPQGADGEVLLDVEVVGSVAPGAAQLVYFAPNTDRGFVDAVTDAVHALPTPAAISISWGQAESGWTGQAMTALDAAIADGAALGITVTAAAGDNGSSDGVTDGQSHVDFPAASPHALACGGTSLHGNAVAGTISSETVWNDGAGGGATGGGVSAAFPLPSWQATAGVPAGATGNSGRGVPDVAGNADPATGYQVLIDGRQAVIGGTSAVAPLWAALTARLAQSLGHSLGLVQQQLYAGGTPGTPAPGLRDITGGNNGAFHAGPGWDACTGLGVPEGSTLLQRLGGSAAGAAGADAATGMTVG
jgi:kumamolisin